MSPSRLIPPILFALAAPATAAHADGLALRYDVYAGGSLAVEMEAELVIAPTGYRFGAGLKLAGMYALFTDWDMQASVSGAIADGAIRPAAYDKRSEGGERWATVRYSDGVIAHADGNPSPDEEDTSTVPDAIKTTAVDPLSGIVGVLSQVAETGQCSGSMHLFDGQSYFTVTSVDRGAADAPSSRYGAYAGPAVLCEVTIDDSAPYGRTDSDPRTVVVWLAQPVPHAPHVPVRIETQSRFGAVRAHLTDYWSLAGETARSQ